MPQVPAASASYIFLLEILVQLESATTAHLLFVFMSKTSRKLLSLRLVIVSRVARAGLGTTYFRS
ncbi:MAG: hypothetical protein DLM53_11150 [Candidatus Eremiobacter antarcticus]|nr:MAG: hypothetical protein DLM53_11150 [Candidatus Eremiobacter sp. RRmetagenome_bin22]